MPSTLLKPKIQQRIVQEIKVGPFFRASYDPTSDELQDVDATLAQVPLTDDPAPPSPTVVPPRSVKVNSVSSAWALEERTGLRRASERRGWTFQAQVQFAHEVIAEGFEDRITFQALCIPPDSVTGTRAVEIFLVNAQYEHPPTTQAQNGTKINYLFEAIPRRR